MSKPVIRASEGAIIGGVFGLAEPWPLARSEERLSRLFQQDGCLHLANASSAFWLLARALRPGRVWLPSYLCGSVIKAFVQAGVPVNFFRVDERLRVQDDKWLERVGEGDLVVRINYFGFRNSEPVFEAARARGALLVDDAAQALLTQGIGDDSDFVVYSPRKFIGVPDGGVLVARKPFELGETLRAPPAEWWLEAFSAVLLRREFDRSGTSRDWFRYFQHSEATAPIGPFFMSTLSVSLVNRAFDFVEIAERRRRNYLCLSQLLGEYACFAELPDAVVPLGFPIRLKNRDVARKALFQERIFAPVHWPVDEMIPFQFNESRRLAGEILTLVCDQRCGVDDMKRTAEQVLKSCAAESVGKND